MIQTAKTVDAPVVSRNGPPTIEEVNRLRKAKMDELDAIRLQKKNECLSSLVNGFYDKLDEYIMEFFVNNPCYTGLTMYADKEVLRIAKETNVLHYTEFSDDVIVEIVKRYKKTQDCFVNVEPTWRYDLEIKLITKNTSPDAVISAAVSDRGNRRRVALEAKQKSKSSCIMS